MLDKNPGKPTTGAETKGFVDQTTLPAEPIVSQFVAGLFLGALYLRSRSILITSAAYYAFNATGRLAMWLIVGL